jgi:hypothetical protein
MPGEGRLRGGARRRGGAMTDSEGAIAPAEPARETSPPATWRIGRFTVAGSLVVSAAIHFVLIAPAVILTSRLLQSEPAQSVTVDLVTPEELAAASKPAEPEKPKPQQPPAAPAQSEAPLSQVASADNPFATPLLPPPPASPALGDAGLLTSLAGLAPVAKQDGGASDVQADLTADDIRAFAMHVQSCWRAPAGVAKEPRLFVVLRVRLRRDGSLMADPALVQGLASTLGPVLFDSAKRAIRECTPYSGLPVAKYDEWKALDLRFTPSGISNASTVDSGPRAPRSG